MISIKYQVFFFDESLPRSEQLSAVQPAFKSPGAVDALLKTLRFGKTSCLVAIGTDKQITSLLTLAQKLDMTEWLKMSIEKRKEELLSLATRLGMNCSSDGLEGGDEKQVLGDDPPAYHQIEGKAPKVRMKYPVDLHPKDYDTWDAVGKEFKAELKQRGKTPEEKMAIHRILYQSVQRKLNLPAWSATTFTQIHDERMRLRAEIVAGQAKALVVLAEMQKYLLDEDLIKNVRPLKYYDCDRHDVHHMFYMTNVVTWTLDPKRHAWLSIADYVVNKATKKVGFSRKQDQIRGEVDRVTELEIVKISDKEIDVYINHNITAHQASILTQEDVPETIIKEMCRLGRSWLKTGKFPSLELK